MLDRVYGTMTPSIDTGLKGEPRIGIPIELYQTDNTGVTSWQWRLFPPPGSKSTLADPASSKPFFTPDVPGDYVVLLSLNGHAVERCRMTFTVAAPKSGSSLSDRLRAASVAGGPTDTLLVDACDLMAEAADELDAIQARAESAILRPESSARAAVDAWMDTFVERSQHFEDTLVKAQEKIRDLKRDGLDFKTKAMHHEAAHGLSETAHAPTVRLEHFPMFGAIDKVSGYATRSAEQRASIIEQGLRLLAPGQRLAVHDEANRVDLLILDPGQAPPEGQAWNTVTVSADDLSDRLTIGQINTPATRERADLGLEWQAQAEKVRSAVAVETDARLEALEDGQSLAVSSELDPEFMVLNPGETPPLGRTWTIYEPITADLRALALQRRADAELTRARTMTETGPPPADACLECGGDGYFHGPRLGDEACPACGGSGKDASAGPR